MMLDNFVSVLLKNVLEEKVVVTTLVQMYKCLEMLQTSVL
jgi:hypothetical protein